MGPRAIIVTDSDGVIRMWSAGAEALFGFPAAEAVGATLDLIVPETYKARHWAGFRRAIERGVADPDGVANIPVRRRDGTVLRYPGRLLLLNDAFGGAVGAAAIFAPPEENTGLVDL